MTKKTSILPLLRCHGAAQHLALGFTPYYVMRIQELNHPGELMRLQRAVETSKRSKTQFLTREQLAGAGATAYRRCPECRHIGTRFPDGRCPACRNAVNAQDLTAAESLQLEFMLRDIHLLRALDTTPERRAKQLIQLIHQRQEAKK